MQNPSPVAPIPLFAPIDPTLATGAQPAPTDFTWLAAQGFEAVINLNLPGARSYLPEEADLVAAQGMAYVPMPIDCSRLSEQQYAAFEQAMRSLSGRRVFVHCAANIKSSGFVHVYRVKARGEPAEVSLAELRALHAGHEPKWQAWFRQLGAA